MEQLSQSRSSIEESVYRNRYIILGIIFIGTFMGVLDSNMVNIALPTITKHFGVGLAESQWAVTGYLLSMSGLFIFFGKVSGYVGKARLFVVGWGLFGLSSLACGLAPGMDALIAFRILQGAGTSIALGVAMPLIYMVFPPQERGRAIGLAGIVMGGAALVGPGLGGLITDRLGWEYMFFVNVPLCLVLLVASMKYMKIPEVTAPKLDMDWIGAATQCLAVVSLLLLCTEIANGLAVTTAMVVYATAFVLSSVAFLAYESRCPRPLLDLSIFRNRKFTLPIISGALLFTGISMVNTLAPFFFQGALGYSASDVGLITLVVPLFMMFASPVSGALYDKRHYRFQSAAGALIYCVGMLIVGAGILAVDLWAIVLGFAIRGVGLGIFTSPNNIETLGPVPREKVALASNVLYTANYMAMMVGVALSTILVTAYLDQNGYRGPVMGAGQSLLSDGIGSIMLLSAALCVLAAVASALRNVGQKAV